MSQGMSFITRMMVFLRSELSRRVHCTQQLLIHRNQSIALHVMYNK